MTITSMLAYSLSTALLLALLYLGYKWTLAGENRHRLNRALLLLIYAVAFAAPPLADKIAGMDLWHTQNPASTVEITIAELTPVMVEVAPTHQPAWPLWLAGIYIAGMAAVAIFTLASLARLRRIIHRSESHIIDGRRVVVSDSIKYAPFSIGNIIVLSSRDFNDAGGMILIHEKSHIALRHWIDLLLAQTVCVLQWYNPAAWLMRDELRTVHEYQADERVIRQGVGIKDYQLLLIKKAVGARFPSLANSLNHSKLKKRITMMYNQKRTRPGAGPGPVARTYAGCGLRTR